MCAEKDPQRLRARLFGLRGCSPPSLEHVWSAIESIPQGLKPDFAVGWDAKAEALAYLEATARAKTNADSLRE